MRTEVSISLTLAWCPTTPLEPRDVPVVRNFLAAVKGMMRLPGRGISLSGPVTMLEAAFGRALPAPESGQESEARPRTWREGEREMLRQALLAAHGNRSEAARRLAVDVKTLRNRMKAHGLRDEFPAKPGPRSARALVTA